MGNRDARNARLRVLLIVVVVFAALTTFVWWRSRRAELVANNIDPHGQTNANASIANTSSAPSAPSPIPTETSTPTPTAWASLGTPAPSVENAQPSQPAPPTENFVGTLKLLIPVVGVRPDQLLDTFADARSEGRVHDAIDIPAPAGTAVVAAADGEIIKLFQSERGGTTIYQLSTDKKIVYYYAHLQRYADGLTAGKFARQGETIAFVGDTGNAGAGNFHLHFSIALVADPKRYWEGVNINPYPLLRK